jgi:hypothetical protein
VRPIDRFFVRVDRYSDNALVVGFVAVVVAFWLGFGFGAAALVKACS